jgi:hypothetical protein
MLLISCKIGTLPRPPPTSSYGLRSSPMPTLPLRDWVLQTRHRSSRRHCAPTMKLHFDMASIDDLKEGFQQRHHGQLIGSHQRHQLRLDAPRKPRCIGYSCTCCSKATTRYWSRQPFCHTRSDFEPVQKHAIDFIKNRTKHVNTF